MSEHVVEVTGLLPVSGITVTLTPLTLEGELRAEAEAETPRPGLDAAQWGMLCRAAATMRGGGRTWTGAALAALAHEDGMAVLQMVAEVGRRLAANGGLRKRLGALVLLIARETGWSERSIWKMPLERVEVYARLILKARGVNLDEGLEFEAPSDAWREDPELMAKLREAGARV